MNKLEEKDTKKVKNSTFIKLCLLLILVVTFFTSIYFLTRIFNNTVSNTKVINVDEEYMQVIYYVTKPGIYRITNTALYTDKQPEIKHKILKETEDSYGWAFYLSYGNNWLLEIENIKLNSNSRISITVDGKKIAFTEENYIGKSIIMKNRKPQVLTIN